VGSTLCGAWALLLCRYAGESEVAFGFGVSADAPDLPRIRAEVPDATPVGAWIRSLHERVQEGLRHAGGADADPARAEGALESAFLQLEEGQGSPPDAAGIAERLRSLPVPCGLAAVAAGARRLTLLYDPERFDAAAIQRMLGHFETLLRGIAAHPEAPCAALEMVTDAERRQLLFAWNDTRRSYPEATLAELFRARVAEAPDRIAVVFEDQELSYGALQSRASQLARHLQGLGVGPDSLVGIHLERSLEMVIGLLGILEAGGAYLPLDPDLPAERLGFMISDAGIAALLTSRALAGRLPPVGAPVVRLDADGDAISRQPSSPPESRATPDHLAYAIYTSGSTGRPKGALNGQRAVANRLHWMQEEYGLTPRDSVLQKTPFGFDVSVWEFFWPLITGARLVLARPGGHWQADYLVDLIERQRISILHFVPSMLRLFLEQPDLERCRTLRHVFCSGEALPFELQQRFFEKLDANLHNLYGPTEAAIDVTYWACRREAAGPVVPIGYPVANTRILILDRHMRLVPIGVTGELHIGGVQLARGYLGRPELTAERFVPDPTAPGERLYKTGDLARRLPDGSVEYLGRLDHQIKIRGFRIELGEIESVLRTHPDVRDAVVVTRGEACGARLVAYVVAEARPGLEAELRRFLERQLPDYMVPSAAVVLDALPLSPNGKVDRRALPAPLRERPALEEAFSPPTTPLEQYLAGIWCRLLELDRVGVSDPFFELGGDSLRAAEFINEVQRDLGVFIYVVSVFEAPTIREYAAFLREDYAEAVLPRFGEEGPRAPARPGREIRIDEAAVARMRQAIPSRPPSCAAEADATRNPPALFILAPPRSGTSLLRVILAGHPDLMACSELQLLGFHSLQERKAAFSGKYSLWLDGTIRALMEVRGCDAATAARLMEDCERQGLTTRAFYGLLQGWIGSRMLVDKTPFYALDLETLRVAERDFESPLYIHLTRHPYAMVRSFEEQHMDQVLRLGEHPFSRRQLAELVYTVSHQNILEFLKQVPGHRQVRMRFEDLVSRPRPVLEGMCEALGLPFHPALLDPYGDLERKMLDGVHGVSTPMGDTKFLEHRRIDPGVGEAWRGVEGDDFLGGVTWELAEVLGYPAPGRGETTLPEGGDGAPSRRDLRQARRRRRLEHREEGMH
jgi:amino acid adenylation domain-containing protein